MDDYSLGQFLAILILLAHVLTAVAASVVLTTIPRENYPKIFFIALFSWVIPFFGALLFIRHGKYVPSLGGDAYQTILYKAANEHAAKINEREQIKLNRYGDSGYGGSPGEYDGGGGSDGGGGE